MKMIKQLENLEKIDTNLYYDKVRNVYRVHLGYNRKYFENAPEDLEYLTLEDAKQGIREIRQLILKNKLIKIKAQALTKDREEMKKIIPYPYNALQIVMSEEEIDNLSLDTIDNITELVERSENVKPRECDIFLSHFRDNLTLTEIGKDYNVSRERIRQICFIVCKKLKYLVKKHETYLANRNIILEEERQEEQLNKYRSELVELFRQKGEYTEDMIITFGEVQLTPTKARYKNEILNMGVEELDLSVRTFNCMRRANIQTVGELTEKTENEIYKIRNLGKKSLKELIKKLRELGLKFADE